VRRSSLPQVDRRSPRLLRRRTDGREELFTRAAGAPPPVYGERWISTTEGELRSWDPHRSKLAAGLVRGWDGVLPAPGERWLYLGASTGTTASHVADLVGPSGRVYAVEKSLRPFVRLLNAAFHYEGLLPIFADARQARALASLVPAVDGIYLDLAQPDQVAIALANARLFLSTSGKLLMALKTASLRRDAEPAQLLAESEAELRQGFELDRTVKLDPLHKRHFLVGGNPTARLFGATPSPKPPAGRRR
jgi:fibrillarin-like pre-rRNA processing protein